MIWRISLEPVYPTLEEMLKGRLDRERCTRTIDSYMGRFCYHCFEDGAEQVEVMRGAICRTCWWLVWSGVWGVIGERYAHDVKHGKDWQQRKIAQMIEMCGQQEGE